MLFRMFVLWVVVPLIGGLLSCTDYNHIPVGEAYRLSTVPSGGASGSGSPEKASNESPKKTCKDSDKNKESTDDDKSDDDDSSDDHKSDDDDCANDHKSNNAKNQDNPHYIKTTPSFRQTKQTKDNESSPMY